MAELRGHAGGRGAAAPIAARNRKPWRPCGTFTLSGSTTASLCGNGWVLPGIAVPSRWPEHLYSVLQNLLCSRSAAEEVALAAAEAWLDHDPEAPPSLCDMIEGRTGPARGIALAALLRRGVAEIFALVAPLRHTSTCTRSPRRWTAATPCCPQPRNPSSPTGWNSLDVAESPNFPTCLPRASPVARAHPEHPAGGRPLPARRGGNRPILRPNSPSDAQRREQDSADLPV